MSLFHTPYCPRSIIWRLDSGTGMLAPRLPLISYAAAPTESLPSSTIVHGKWTYSIWQNTPLEGITLTMSRATASDLAADLMTYAGIGGPKNSVTYLNIPVSSIHKVLIALRMD